MSEKWNLVSVSVSSNPLPLLLLLSVCVMPFGLKNWKREKREEKMDSRSYYGWKPLSSPRALPLKCVDAVIELLGCVTLLGHRENSSDLPLGKCTTDLGLPSVMQSTSDKASSDLCGAIISLMRNSNFITNTHRRILENCNWRSVKLRWIRWKFAFF